MLNKMRFRVACAAGICAMAAAAAAAQADDSIPSHESALELSGYLGGFFPSDSHEYYDPETSSPISLGTGASLGARVGYFPMPFVGVETEFDWTSLKADNDDRVSLIGWRAQVVGQLHGRLTPFVLAGFGSGTINSPESTLGNDTDLHGHVGIGAKFWVMNSLALRVDGRFIRAPKAEPEDAEGKGTNHFAFYLGATYALDLGAPGANADAVPVVDADPDGDGVLGDADACPYEAGKGADGCPERDTDGDGIVGANDECPDEAENMNAFEDTDGCPDTIPDSDGDGLNDQEDECPEKPEDMDSFEDKDGCPDDDNDNDGVVDAKDGCVSEPGPVENRGCPDGDRDGDTVVDRLDNCPDVAGTVENRGCKKKQLVVITQNQIQILDKVFFQTGKSKVRSRSRTLLNNVADVLKAHPEIKMIRVEGHTDNVGKAEKNKTLSQQRAEAVVAYLIKRGVSADRLEGVGHGQERPLADNAIKTGRDQNRRVEFNIVDGAK